MRFIFCTLLFMLFGSAGFAAEAPKPVTIAFPTWIGNGVVFVAKEKGYFGNLPVDVKVMDDTAAMATAFRSGQLDIMTTTPDNMAILASQGIEAKIFYMTDYSDGADGIISQFSIKSVKELKGKTVGYVRGYASHYLLSKALAKAGLTMADIKPVEFSDPSLAAQAMLSSKVDAAVTWEPFLTQVVSDQKGNVLTTTKDFGDLIPGDLIASDKMLQSRSQEVKQVIVGLQKAYDYIRANPQEAAVILGKGFGTKTEDMTNAMKGVHFADDALEAKHLCGDHPRTAEIYDNAGNFWLNQKVVTKKGPEGKTVISPIGCSVFKK